MLWHVYVIYYRSTLKVVLTCVASIPIRCAPMRDIITYMYTQRNNNHMHGQFVQLFET
jgi:hypothetical protein